MTYALIPKGQKPGRMKRTKRKCPEHLEWVASQPCCVCGRNNVAVHHLIHWPVPGKIGRRDDAWVIPICRSSHDHAQGVHGPEGEIRFLMSRGVDARQVAEDLQRRSPHRGKLV